MAVFPLEILSPDGIQFEGDVREIVVRTTAGEITVLRKHQPLISQLEDSIAIVRTDTEELRYKHGVGTLDIRHNGAVVMLIDSVELLTE